METQVVIIWGLKGERIQETSGLLYYNYNNMNWILKLSTMLPRVREKEMTSEILYKGLSLSLIYIHV